MGPNSMISAINLCPRGLFPFIFACAFFVTFASQVNAQPFALDEKLKPTELKLTDYAASDPRTKGKVAIVEVTQKNETLYFFAKGISIFSPVMVFVEASNKADKLAVSLHKNTWNTIERSGETDASGVWTDKFKTGGDVGIKITARKFPAKYQIVLWVGDEIDVTMPTPFKPRPSR